MVQVICAGLAAQQAGQSAAAVTSAATATGATALVAALSRGSPPPVLQPPRLE